MIQKQVQLTEEQARALEDLAARRGVSASEIILGAVDEVIAANKESNWQRATAIIGRYHSGKADISERHDEYLAEGYLQ